MGQQGYISPERGNEKKSLLESFMGFLKGGSFGGNSGKKKKSMRDTMDPQYGRRDRDNGNRGRTFLSPQPRREGREDRGNNQNSMRDIQRPFWKSQNGKSNRGRSRRMNLTLKEVHPGEENQFRGKYGAFEPSTNDSARGIQDTSRRESKVNFF